MTDSVRESAGQRNIGRLALFQGARKIQLPTTLRQINWQKERLKKRVVNAIFRRAFAIFLAA